MGRALERFAPGDLFAPPDPRRFGARRHVRPWLDARGGIVTSFDFNRVVSTDPDTVFAADAGPLNHDEAASAVVQTEELWIRFPNAYPLSRVAVLLGRLSPGGLAYTYGGDGGFDVEGEWKWVTAGWDPTALTWNNKPSSFYTAHASTLQFSQGAQFVNFAAAAADDGSTGLAAGDGFWISSDLTSNVVHGVKLAIVGTPTPDSGSFVGWAASGLALYLAA